MVERGGEMISMRIHIMQTDSSDARAPDSGKKKVMGDDVIGGWLVS